MTAASAYPSLAFLETICSALSKLRPPRGGPVRRKENAKLGAVSEAEPQSPRRLLIRLIIPVRRAGLLPTARARARVSRSWSQWPAALQPMLTNVPSAQYEACMCLFDSDQPRSVSARCSLRSPSCGCNMSAD